MGEGGAGAATEIAEGEVEEVNREGRAAAAVEEARERTAAGGEGRTAAGGVRGGAGGSVKRK